MSSLHVKFYMYSQAILYLHCRYNNNSLFAKSEALRFLTSHSLERKFRAKFLNSEQVGLLLMCKCRRAGVRIGRQKVVELLSINECFTCF